MAAQASAGAIRTLEMATRACPDAARALGMAARVCTGAAGAPENIAPARVSDFEPARPHRGTRVGRSRPLGCADHSKPLGFSRALKIGRSRPLRLRWGARINRSNVLGLAGAPEITYQRRFGTAWALGIDARTRARSASLSYSNRARPRSTTQL